MLLNYRIYVNMFQYYFLIRVNLLHWVLFVNWLSVVFLRHKIYCLNSMSKIIKKSNDIEIHN